MEHNDYTPTQIMALLKQKQGELAEIEAHIQKLKDNIDKKNSEFKVIQDNVDLTMGRLNRAGRLTSALADEELRWGQIVKDLTAELWAIPGDVLIASAYVAYVSPFPSSYRKRMASRWVTQCKELNIPSSQEFRLVAFHLAFLHHFISCLPVSWLFWAIRTKYEIGT